MDPSPTKQIDYSITFIPMIPHLPQAVTCFVPGSTVRLIICLAFCFLLFFPSITYSQNPSGETKPSVQDHWLQHPRIVVSQTSITRAKYPVVDVHTHFYVKGRHDTELLDRYVRMMDQNNIAVSISLDGTLGSKLDVHQEYLWGKYKHRFLIFANLDFQGTGNREQYGSWDCNQPYFVRNVVEQLKRQHASGVISGLKLFKDFGLRYKDASGACIRIDDPQWDPIWRTCGELGIPVIMHTADPSAFFLPIDSKNERQRELENHPDWSFHSSEFPSRASLHEARNRVIQRHPKTNFIAAHFGNDAEDLKELAGWLDAMPNLYVEFASRINELGRQPYTARQFFLDYSTRILFGTDGPWPEARLRCYWRFLETKDEYFPYSEKVPPPQGDWNIYGFHLEDAILRQVYYENASRLIPGVAEKLKPFLKD